VLQGGCPAVFYVSEPMEQGLWKSASGQFPILDFYGRQKRTQLLSESRGTYEDIVRAEGRDESARKEVEGGMDTPESSAGRVKVEGELAELLRRENGQDTDEKTQAEESAAAEEQDTEKTAESEQEQVSGNSHEAEVLAKKESYQWEYFKKYDTLVKEFYAIDQSTAADEKQLNLEALLGPDLSIEKRQDGLPQILIYHTHSQEDFADSIPGDERTTILGVGEFLAELLRQKGYNVMHHMGKYDVEKRDYAYSYSLPAMEELLEQNPSIEVVIDLHRDEVAEGTKLITDIDGRPTAKFMFFNGMSRTRKHGDIDYLPNENIGMNLAFSFQMQALCNEYYPGLTRRIYLKGYRYNMHLKPRYLLVEMGAQTNTYEECYNACIPLANMLDLELSGVDFYNPS
ncbi:MAG: stage II sporulation protein P, partial [Eisenbergiella sp.]